MADKIQRVELDCYDVPIFCIFCGQEVVGDSNEKKPKDIISPCSHTLFITTDEGFEYRSKRFNAITGLKDDDDNFNPDIGDHNFDSFTDLVNIKNSIKLAMYVPAPGGMGAYVGFAPIEG